ncbi:MAG: glycosyltransferase family 2 protein [Lachnospiraceae bacterium]|nr:glycosyltransferase family 2 protein [Lachnospiraceae bacterium]
MKLSIIIPVYYNEDNLHPLYADIKEKVIEKIDYEYEIIMVNDGSKDKSWEVMQELAAKDENIRTLSLSRNFGSHAAVLCGLSYCTGNCAVVKAADLQEPTELILQMVDSWKAGNNVVLAVRKGREDAKRQTFFANLYYNMVRKTALPNMPKGGFDVFLLDRKVITVLKNLDEKNSILTGQILWSGFKTDIVYYTRLAREIGTSKWTLKKKIKQVKDTLFGFSSFPITVVIGVGVGSLAVACIWAVAVLVAKLTGYIDVSGWTTLFIFNLFSFGITMMTLGILGEYLWRIFDASRNRPPYIVEDDNKDRGDTGRG